MFSIVKISVVNTLYFISFKNALKTGFKPLVIDNVNLISNTLLYSLLSEVMCFRSCQITCYK